MALHIGNRTHLLFNDRRNISIKENHLGEIRNNNQGTPMKIIEYVNTSNLVIEFLDEYHYITNNIYINFKSGAIKNPYDRTIFGIGYLGEGSYKAREIKNGKDMMTESYSVWRHMIQRCYHEDFREKSPSYVGCKICDEWLNYQNFAEWYNKNYYEINGYRMHIDKDILCKGNKIYSPDTCLIVPQIINELFTEKKSNKLSNLPVGISKAKSGYSSSYNGKSLGIYKTLDEAINKHDEFKRIHIKELADQYICILPDKVYKALLSW